MTHSAIPGYSESSVPALKARQKGSKEREREKCRVLDVQSHSCNPT